MQTEIINGEVHKKALFELLNMLDTTARISLPNQNQEEDAKFEMDMPTPEEKADWLMEFRAAKLRKGWCFIYI